MSQSYLHGYFYKEGAWEDIQKSMGEGAEKAMEWARANPEWAGAIGAGVGGAGVGALANGWRGALTGSLAAVPGYLGGKWWETSQDLQEANKAVEDTTGIAEDLQGKNTKLQTTLDQTKQKAQQASTARSRIQDQLKKTKQQLTELRQDPVRSSRDAYQRAAMDAEGTVQKLQKKLREITEQRDTATEKQQALLRILQSRGPNESKKGPLFSELGSTIKEQNPITQSLGLGKDVANVIGAKLQQLEGKRQLTIQELRELADINKTIQNPNVMGEMSSEDITSLSRRLKKLNEKYK